MRTPALTLCCMSVFTRNYPLNYKNSENKCKNGGRMVTLQGRTQCECVGDWRGKRCGKRRRMRSTLPAATRTPSSVTPTQRPTQRPGEQRTRYVCSLSPFETQSICWNVRVQSNYDDSSRTRRQVLKKHRVTCPRHKCGATQIANQTTQTTSTSTTCITRQPFTTQSTTTTTTTTTTTKTTTTTTTTT